MKVMLLLSICLQLKNLMEDSQMARNKYSYMRLSLRATQMITSVISHIPAASGGHGKKNLFVFKNC